jgi:hypothetical protein
VEQFHGSSQGDQFVMGCTQHLCSQQPERRAKSLAPGRKQMLQRDAQIRMGTVRLGTQEYFNFLESLLYGIEK